MDSGEHQQGNEGAPPPRDAAGGRTPAWWRPRGWPGILATVALLGLLAVAFLAGYAAGHSGAPRAMAAVASPSASVAATQTSGAGGVTPSSGAILTASAGPTHPAASTSTPASTPTAAVPPASPVFQTFTSSSCQVAAAPSYSCTTIEMAVFTAGGGASQYTAQVAFASSGVVIGQSTDGKPNAAVVAQSSASSADGFLVVMGELSFPGPGTYAYSVTITDTANGDSTIWQGSMPVGGSAG